MNIYNALIIAVYLVAIVFLVTYELGKSKSSRILKYIPATVFVFGIVLFYLSLQFISYGYEVIFNLVVILFLLIIAFVTSITVAIIIEIMNKRKNK